LPSFEIEAERADRILFGSEGASSATVLQRRSPLECLFPEGDLGRTSSSSPETTADTEDRKLPFAEAHDERAYLERLMSNMTPPEVAPTLSKAVPRDGNGSAEIATGVGHGINGFQLRSGPGDVTAYYDFHNLHIAFEDV